MNYPQYLLFLIIVTLKWILHMKKLTRFLEIVSQVCYELKNEICKTPFTCTKINDYFSFFVIQEPYLYLALTSILIIRIYY